MILQHDCSPDRLLAFPLIVKLQFMQIMVIKQVVHDNEPGVGLINKLQ